MSLKKLFIACACMALAPVSALAQQNMPEEEVVVRAGSVEEAVRGFVSTVTSEAGRTNQLAVWRGSLCIGVMGLHGPHAQILIDGVARHAANLEINLGEPGCPPNLLIIFTGESDAVARVLVDQYRIALAYYSHEGVTRGRAALEDFATTPRAVRWWHVSLAADELGPLPRDNMLRGPPVVRTSAAGSRVETATYQVFTRAIIVVDAARVAGMRLESLADYIAMASLAQIDPTADTSSYPTILNAFRNGSLGDAHLRLTEWDEAYLHGLYFSPAYRNANAQRLAIRRAVLEANE